MMIIINVETTVLGEVDTCRLIQVQDLLRQFEDEVRNCESETLFLMYSTIFQLTDLILFLWFCDSM